MRLRLPPCAPAPLLALLLVAASARAQPVRKSAPPTAAATAAASARGTLFIVGGGTQPRALVEHFVALAGGPGRARIAVVPTASAEGATSGREKADDLRALGADAFVLDVDRAGAESDSVVRLIAGATGIWFGGGDQSRITRVFAGTAALRAMRARYRAGAVVGGTSAGAAIMSDSMLTGNQLRDGALDTSATGYPRVERATIEVVPGLGFLSGAIVDQHFLRRQRSNRLLAVVLERPSLLGVGIDEGTAVVVGPDGRWRVEGASAAMIIDARDAAVTPAATPRLGAAGLRVHLLPAGGTFDPGTGRARLPADAAAPRVQR